MTESKLWPALIRARQKIGPIPKTAKNPHYGNSYAPLGEILGVVLPVLHGESLALSGVVTDVSGITGLIVSILHVETGESTSSLVPLIGASDMQKLGGAMTYAMRYGIGMLLALELDEDDDGNRASQRTAQTTPARTQAPAAGAPAPAARQPSNVGASRTGKQRKEEPRDDDAEAATHLATLLDLKAESEGQKWRLLKNGKFALYGKNADAVNVEPGEWSAAQLAARGSLAVLRGRLEFFCKQAGIDPNESGAGFPSNDDLLDAI